MKEKCQSSLAYGCTVWANSALVMYVVYFLLMTSGRHVGGVNGVGGFGKRAIGTCFVSDSARLKCAADSRTSCSGGVSKAALTRASTSAAAAASRSTRASEATIAFSTSFSALSVVRFSVSRASRNAVSSRFVSAPSASRSSNANLDASSRRFSASTSCDCYTKSG